jgi:hypothetical protein
MARAISNVRIGATAIDRGDSRPGFDPAINAYLFCGCKNVDGQDKPGHEDEYGADERTPVGVQPQLLMFQGLILQGVNVSSRQASRRSDR